MEYVRWTTTVNVPPVIRQLHRMQAELEAAMEEEVSREREEAKKKRGGWSTRPRDFTY